MPQIVIEVPDEVYQSLKALAASKGISFEDFCKMAFAAGFTKRFSKKFKQ